MQPTSTPRFTFRLDPESGVPFYRQLIDQILTARAAGLIRPGDQLPTVRQLAVDLSINPNTVVRAYRDLEIRGVLSTPQGTGTFLTAEAARPPDEVRQKRLHQMVAEFVTRASGEGYSVQDVRQALVELFAR